MEVFPLVTGWIRVDQKNFRPSAHSHVADHPVLAWLIHAHDQWVLFDTGPGTLTECTARGRTHFSRAAEETLEAQLAAHGIGLGDLRWVVISHLHWDHAGRWGAFTPEVLVVPPAEVEFCVNPLDSHRRYFDPLTAEQAELLRQAAAGYDTAREALCGLGVTLIGLPGHTPGSQGALVEAARKRRVLLAGDTIPTLANLASGHLEPNGISCDDDASNESAELIIKAATDVLPSHDSRMVRWRGSNILDSLDELRSWWGVQ